MDHRPVPVDEAASTRQATDKLTVFRLTRRRWASVWALLASGGLSCAPQAQTTYRPAEEQPPNSDESDTTASTESPLCKELSPGPSPVRLLTKTQYDNTIRDLLSDPSEPSSAFPSEHEVAGFDNNAETHQANPLLVEKHIEAAQQLAKRAVDNHLDDLAPCADTTAEAESACGQQFIEEFGARAFRRPLEAAEAAVFDNLFANTLATDGYAMAVRLVIEAMLQSPQFLYRVEARMGAGHDIDQESGVAVPVGPYELASRLSYFLHDSMPDEQLFEAAARGELSSAEQVEAEARRLIEDPKARDMVSDFHRQWMRLDSLPAIVRVNDAGLDSAQLGLDWQGSLSRYLDAMFWENGRTFSNMFSSDVVFVNARLAQLYGTPEAPMNGEDFIPVQVPQSRYGLLTQPALLALLSHSDQSSPVQRGVFLREHLLCESIPPPPPSVDNTPPDPDPNATTRERFAVHTESPVCASCHQLIDPPGFALEAYDWLGRYRTEENGAPIDTTADLTDFSDTNLDGFVAGATELAQKMANSPQARSCLATQWYRYAMGRVEGESDACSLEQTRNRFEQSGGNFTEMLVGIALSDAFRYRFGMNAPPPEAEP